MIKLERQNKPFAINELNELENLGINLPEDYLTFITETNGGLVSDENSLLCETGTFWCWGNDFQLNYLYTLKEVIDYLHDKSPIFPDNLVEIGNDSSGNILCIAIEGKYYGNTYIFTPSIPAENDPVKNKIETYEDIHFTHSSFTELTQVLKPYKPV